MAYQPVDKQQVQYQQTPYQQMPAPGTVVMAGVAGESFGLTTTPNQGWECCNTPPCVLCAHPIYTSNNHKSWGETGEWAKSCCGSWRANGLRFRPGGEPFDYQYDPSCCSDPVLRVERRGQEVGRITMYNNCIPCGKLGFNATDTQGRSHYTWRYPECSCAMYCGRKQGCCSSPAGCCASWARYDLVHVNGPEQPNGQEQHAVTITNQHHALCPVWYPSWTGYDITPNTDDEDKALLLGLLLLYGPLYPRRAIAWNSTPPTLGVGVQ